MAIELVKVSNKKDTRRFLDFSWEEPHRSLDIPVLHDVVRAMLDGSHPSCEYGDVEGWLLIRNNKVVGKTTLHTNRLFDEKLNEKVLIFGCANIIDDQEVADKFVSLLNTGASQRGCTTIFGPASLLPNQHGGATVSHFDIPGFVDSAYTPEFFVTALRDRGFSQRFESHTWICDGLQDVDFDPSQLFAFDDDRIATENIEIHYGNRKKFNEQRELLLPLLNKSFSTLPYYTNIDQREFRFATEGLEYLIDEKLLIYLMRNNKPIAFVLVIPDISEFLIACSGNLNFFHQSKLFFSRKKFRKKAILIIKGTDPDFAGMGYQTLLHRELFTNLRNGGYEEMRSTFVEHSNPGSAASYVRVDGHPLHDYCFFSAKVSP
ncbi:MAG TPA: hypothetical protein PKB15_08110 [Acidimicrobiia bacterium]|nr:hypothetical protein [Acidimicrobiia bacterium]